MKAVFNDLQEPLSPLDGAPVCDRKGLITLLDDARNRKPFGCELVGENGYKLTLGISNEIGFVQHSRADGEPPYLVAFTAERCCDQERCEFLIGGTPTPIGQRFCLPIRAVKEIAAHFIELGERSQAYSWEEI